MLRRMRSKGIEAEAYGGMPYVKICGIMRPEHGVAAAEMGADMIGMVFAESRRKVNVEAAREIVEAVRGGERQPLMVGVFVNETPERMLEVAGEVGLDVLQLSGDEEPKTANICAERYAVIKAMRFAEGSKRGDVLEALGEYRRATSPNMRFLIDAHQPGVYGGTGTTADWRLVAQLVKHYRIMLAGGLTPENVGEAIGLVAPWGVDVSSGVEKDGVKDTELIRAFLRAAKKNRS